MDSVVSEMIIKAKSGALHPIQQPVSYWEGIILTNKYLQIYVLFSITETLLIYLNNCFLQVTDLSCN